MRWEALAERGLEGSTIRACGADRLVNGALLRQEFFAVRAALDALCEREPLVTLTAEALQFRVMEPAHGLARVIGSLLVPRDASHHHLVTR